MKPVEVAARGSIAESRGVLFVVATPIGNMGDITVRAIKALTDADLILCESTARARKLLTALGIRGKKTVYLRENGVERQLESICRRLKEGFSAALIADAGTPLISDPGVELVDMAYRLGIRVSAAPGASALSAAISVAPFKAGAIAFIGFLPRSSGKRRREFARWRDLSVKTVFFESPHRIAKTLADAYETFGPARCLVCREISKIHESNLLTDLAAAQNIAWPEKGEYTVVIAPTGKPTPAGVARRSLADLSERQRAKVIGEFAAASNRRRIDQKTAASNKRKSDRNGEIDPE